MAKEIRENHNLSHCWPQVTSYNHYRTHNYKFYTEKDGYLKI